MSRYNTATLERPAKQATAIKAGTKRVINHQGGVGYLREDAKSELFLSAATSFMTNKFYETESELRKRQRKLIATVAIEDPEWTLAFVAWLRTEGNLRTGALVIAADSVHARLAKKQSGLNRQIISAALQRPDEPGEMLAYWTSTYGRNLPAPVKRGVADAVKRLYTERAFLKYDSAARAFRFADVIQMTHPKFDRSYQDSLACYAIGQRYGRTEDDFGLTTIRANRELRSIKPSLIEQLANQGQLAEYLADAGMTWEDVPSLVQGPWTAKLWEAIIPSMGVMALVRNLRNFDQAGISMKAQKMVAAKLADREAVRKSRILPLRMLTAYANAGSAKWAAPLEVALQNTLDNIPALPGRTLILVDLSGSMFGWGDRSQIDNAKTAGLFGAALALRAEDPTLIHYGSTARAAKVTPGGAILPMVMGLRDMGGTNTAGAFQKYYNGHDRVVLLTDEQQGGYYGRGIDDVVPKNVPLITFNLAGYQTGSVKPSMNRLTFSSLSDSAWKLIDMWGNGSDAWPWEAA